MARSEEPREDLLREATALVERAELHVEGEASPVVVGFRRDGALSLFFGEDPVYQLNAQRQLRRSFVAGRLYKADRGRLVRLERQRTAEQVVLARHDLNDDETADFLTAMRQRLQALADRLSAGAFSIAGQVPRDAPIVERVAAVLRESLVAPWSIAPRANVGG